MRHNLTIAESKEFALNIVAIRRQEKNPPPLTPDGQTLINGSLKGIINLPEGLADALADFYNVTIEEMIATTELSFAKRAWYFFTKRKKLARGLLQKGEQRKKETYRKFKYTLLGLQNLQKELNDPGLMATY